MDDAISRTERRKLLTRANLLAAGEQQISTTGLARLSIHTTTELADVALGTFYNHFANKDELVEEILGRDRRRLSSAIQEQQQRAHDPIEQIAATVATCLWRAVLEPGWARFAAEFWAVGRWPTDNDEPWLLAPVLAAGIASGELTVEDPDLALGAVRDLLGGLLRRYAASADHITDGVMLRQGVANALQILGAGHLDIQRATLWAESHPLQLSAFEEVA